MFALALLERYPGDLPPAEHNRALALFALGRRDEAQAVLRRAHEAYPGILGALLPETLDMPADEGGPGLAIGGAMAAFYNRNETRAAWVGTGALAWAKALDLPQPASKKARKPKAVKPSAASGKPKTGNGGKGASLTAAALGRFGARQETHLRKTFPDYPRLHGLLMAIAWSRDRVMPSKWLEIVTPCARNRCPR